MTKIKHRLKTRNWVAKHNQNPPVRHRDRTDYQRRSKHEAWRQQKELQDGV